MGEYSIKKLSELAGVSARTLRYYDSINLLKPLYISDSGYRYYGEKELELLQQILFYKERGFELQTIAAILYREDFDVSAALKEHLAELEKQQERTAMLIAAVKNTMEALKGERKMSDKEKFEAFKKQLISDNEKRYGEEIREKYGEKEVEGSNRKMMNMTEEDYKHFKELEQQILNKLKQAVLEKASPQSETGKEIALLHKEWISMTWNSYSKEAHKKVAKMYTADERFTAYYDKEVSGCAEFLKDAVGYWIEK